jgi:hypothetical protein
VIIRWMEPITLYSVALAVNALACYPLAVACHARPRVAFGEESGQLGLCPLVTCQMGLPQQRIWWHLREQGRHVVNEVGQADHRVRRADQCFAVLGSSLRSTGAV